MRATGWPVASLTISAALSAVSLNLSNTRHQGQKLTCRTSSPSS
jgi:hypothetical protein